jgi:hypothetical protein
MFKLIRLAIYALVGYTVYQFVTDVIEADSALSASRGRGARGTGRRAAGTPMTGTKRGGGAGKPEVTSDSDGGAVRHRVGRGVVGT